MSLLKSYSAKLHLYSAKLHLNLIFSLFIETIWTNFWTGGWSATLSSPPLCSCSWLMMSVTMTIPQPGAAEAEAWSWCWSWHAPCDPDGWRRSDHLLIGPLVTLCDVVWCCVMLCHKHTTFCHPMSRSTSSHLDTGTLEVWSPSQLLLSMGKYLILQI